jgi:hypothetical protein
MPAHRKATQLLFRKKLTRYVTLFLVTSSLVLCSVNISIPSCYSGGFKVDLLERAIGKSREAIDSMYKSIVAIAESMVRASAITSSSSTTTSSQASMPSSTAATPIISPSGTEASVQYSGGRLYYFLFLAFGDAPHRQEIIGNLITHIGSGSMEEANVALDELHALVIHNAATVLPYHEWVKGILDYLSTLNDNQIRLVYTIFARLATVDSIVSCLLFPFPVPLPPFGITFCVSQLLHDSETIASSSACP